MNHWPTQDRNAMIAFYGDPDPDKDGRPNRAWEDANIAHVVPPFPMVLAWDTAALVKTISIHKKCAPSLTRVLTVIWQTMAPKDREIFEISHYGGGYNFRPMRGSEKLSMHAYGAAIDLSPAINRLGREYASAPRMMPQTVIKAFEAEGWTWGGQWHRPDPQHFQAATVR